MQIIAELEPDRRGPYAGAAGYLSFSGNMDMAITIRTMVTSGGVAYAQGGCGIVYDSVPSSEYDETMNKARALLKAINQAEGPPSMKEVAGAFLIDNYDSFTYNLCQYLAELGQEVVVVAQRRKDGG